MLACPGGPYADPTAVDPFDGWKLIHSWSGALPTPLRLAATIDTWFAGTVSELTDIVDAVLSAERT